MSTSYKEVNFVQLWGLCGAQSVPVEVGLESVLRGLEGWMGKGQEGARTPRRAQCAGLQVAGGLRGSAPRCWSLG